MDLLAFISGVCVALVTVFAIGKYRSRIVAAPSLADELNHIQAKIAMLGEARREPDIFREKRAEFIAALYARLVSLQRHLHEAHVLQTSEGRLYLGGREASEKDIEQKLEREKASLVEEAQKLTEFVTTHRIYFDRAMLEDIDALLLSLQRMMSQSLTAGWLDRGSGAPLTGILSEVTTNMDRIEHTFKKLIGIDDIAAPSEARD